MIIKMKQLALLISIPVILFGAGLGGWKSFDGPPAGRANELSIGKEGSTFYLFAADNTNWLYRSTNLGVEWDSIPITNTDRPTCVVTSPGADTVFIGSGRWNPDYIVMRSIDHGSHWQKKDDDITNDEPNCFAIQSNDPDVVYLGCLKLGPFIPTLFKTTDGGNSWTNLPSPNPDYSIAIYDIAIRPGDPEGNEIVVAGEDGLYYSSTGGNSWVLTSPNY